MEGSGCFRFQNRLSLGNNNGSDQEIDLTLKLGLTNPSKENQDAPQHVLPHNFSNFDRPTFYHQSMGRSEILQNARGHERDRLLGMMKHMPWPLPVLNMLRNNLNMSTGNSAVLQQHHHHQQQQQQLECKICETTYTPTWRKGPQGPKTLCNRCGLRYAREIKKG